MSDADKTIDPDKPATTTAGRARPRILVTGICGFVGRTIAEALLDHRDPAGGDGSAFDLVGIDNLSRRGSWQNTGALARRGVRVIHGDIRQRSDLDLLPDVQWVIDAAANPSVLAGIDGQASSRQLVEHNLGGTIELLEWCRARGAGFILLSTSRVYSIPPLAALPVEVHDRAFTLKLPAADPAGRDPETVPALPPGLGPAGIDESFSTAPPVSLYGSTKVASEQLALEYGAAFGFPVYINRCGVLAGAGQFGRADQGIFSFWLHSWRAGRPLRYIGFDGCGHQVRDCLHPRDLVPLLLAQMRAGPADPRPRLVNASGGLASARSLRQLSDWCGQRWGEREVASQAEPRPFDLPWVVLDHGRATAAWDWRPATHTEDILEEIAAHAEQNPHWLDLTAS